MGGMGRRAAMVATLVVGCGPRSAVDTAQVCVEPKPVQVAPGETLVLTAIATYGCNSTDVVVTCSVVEEAPGELVVTTETTWRRDEPIALGCEQMLHWAEGGCETPPVPEGPVVLRYRGQALAFDVPGVAEGCID